jgi:peptidoglycan/xylan/chitin deacetylase (PgdA/CDA1 family)
MYAAHWYPVNMRDVLTSHIQVPAGKTPVVLTFDDARGSQFRYLPDGATDPNCAVGILEAFHRQHPDWPLRATFYVLPKSAWNPVPFWQPGQETKKLRALVADGFEVANHSTTHRMMTHLSGTELTWEMAECQRYVRDRAPQATMDTMALPGGAAPKDHALWNTLLRGHLGDITYRNRCILMAWGGPSRSWADKKFDPDRIARIGVGPGWAERAIKALSTRRIPPYVSDGNPDTVAVPRSEAKFINPRRLDGARLVVYNDAMASKPKIARKKDGPKPGQKTLIAGKPAGA